jgi:hypothetical protein
LSISRLPEKIFSLWDFGPPKIHLEQAKLAARTESKENIAPNQKQQ